jgi:hypothetical protein
MKKEIDDAIALERADGEWKITECFKDGPLKIRHRYLLAIGMFLGTNQLDYLLSGAFRCTSNATTQRH